MMRLRTFAICLAVGACGGGGGGNPGTPDGGLINGTYHHYVSSAITLPTSTAQATQFGFNLDNDPQGRIDNALGSLLTTLSGQQGADLQTPIDTAVSTGQLVILHSMKAADPQPGTAQTASWQVYLGAKTTSDPNFDGNDTFTIDPASPTNALLTGPIDANGHITVGPGQIPLQLSLVANQPPISVTLQCAQVDATVNSDGTLTGKLGGGITQSDIQNNVLPNLADLLNTRAGECCGPVNGNATCNNATSSNCIQNDACRTDINMCDSSAKTVLQIFDKDDGDPTCCTGNDCMTDGTITHDEVKCNSFITTLLAPDVDLLDSNGKCAPTPITSSSANPDCISLGIGFDGVKANFTATNEH